MWELIKKNKQKSLFLMMGMALCLLVMGCVIGAVWFGTAEGFLLGAFIALAIWLLMVVVSFSMGETILPLSCGAKEITHTDYPRLFNVVEEMKIASSLNKMPRVFVINDVSLNAFAAGLKPEKSVIVVTTGLLSSLNRDELQGVIAHEMSHILNQDVRFMTLAGTMLGGIQLLSHSFLRSLFFMGGSRRRGGGGRGGTHPALLVIAIIFAILGPILAQIFYFAISRKREYLADASAARLTRYPEGLASALNKISNEGSYVRSSNSIAAPMYIANPSQSKSMSLFGAGSTHPPITERIKILRNMAGGASFKNYEEAFMKVKSNEKGLLPQSALTKEENIEIRKPSQDSKEDSSNKKRKREVSDLMLALNQYLFITCVCGLKMKFSSKDKSQKTCPKCKKTIHVPKAELLAATQVLTEATKKSQDKPKEKPPLNEYHRKNSGWESFECSCGHLLQLAPSFSGDKINCRKCKNIVKIHSFA